MKIITGLDGKLYHLQCSRKKNKDVDKSALHLNARELLKEIFPLDIVAEEIFLPGSYGLSADFYLPNRDLIIEVHGQQHYEYSKFFHGDLMGFKESQTRDYNKKQWCDLNCIHYVELPYNEDIYEWRRRIVCRLGKESD